MLELLLDPFRSPYMVRALIEVLLLAVVGGVVGVHVVLRRLAFVSEALQHTVFPGIAVAFVVGRDLLAGAVVAAIATVLILAALTRTRRIEADGALALLTATAFAGGVVVVSRGRSFQHDLTALLFGRILTVDVAQIVQTAVLGLVCIVTLGLLHKELVLTAFDREGSMALGYRPLALEIVVNVVLALVVVAAIRAVGTVLVVAFVVTPAATALLVTRSVARAMAVSIAVAAGCGLVGLVVSFDLSVHGGVTVTSGAMIVVLLTATFGAVAVVAAAGRHRHTRTPLAGT